MDDQSTNKISPQPSIQPAFVNSPKKSSNLPILIIVFLLLIAAAVYGGYYYGHKDVSKLQAQVDSLKSQVKTLNTKLAVSNKKLSTTSSSSNNVTSQLNQNVIKVPTLGVQVVVPDYIKDLTITPVTSPGTYNGQPVISVTVSTATISSAIPACKDVAFGTLTKYKGTYPSSGVTLTSWHEQFNGYYLALSPGEGPCAPSGTSDTDQALLGAQSAVFDASLPSITPI